MDCGRHQQTDNGYIIWGETMHKAIFVGRWGSATRSLTRLILPSSVERLAPAARASSDVDAFYRFGRG
ncbi:hypothetical protein GCM10009608_06470 [Pseudonocardia alaniniphila]